MTTKTPFTLEDMLANAAKTARAAFNKKGEVSPMWLGHTANDEIIAVVPDGWNSGDEKQKAVDKVRAIFREKGVTQYVFMTEAWTLDSASAGSEIAVKVAMQSGRSLEDHPDRREVVFLQAEDKDRCLMAHYFILRPEYGKPTLSALVKMSEAKNMAGRMMGLLKDKVPPYEPQFTPLEEEAIKAVQGILHEPETKAFFESIAHLPEMEKAARVEVWSKKKAREAREAWERSKAD